MSSHFVAVGSVWGAILIMGSVFKGLRSNVLTCNFDVAFCDQVIWKNRGILKFSSEYGPSIKKKQTNKPKDVHILCTRLFLFSYLAIFVFI